MWLSLNILSRMVDISDIAPEDLAHRITMSTAEIESVEYLNEHYKSIYTAKITDVLPHPKADKLSLVDVSTGSRTYRVVCGAPNHQKGDIVPLATTGTRFSDDLIIKETAIRGEKSNGMLCSEKELGISDDHSGIMILPADTKIGVTLDTIYPDRIDVRLEIDNKSITHRPDLWSHQGFAREIGALFDREVRSTVDHSLAGTMEGSEELSIKIHNPEAALRYSGLMVQGITITESPDWLKAALTSIGMRPINNIVDITNYCMAELGEPMHAFDRKKLQGSEIQVRMAKKKETLQTLDGQVFTLSPEDIVIADDSGAIALAGVMGGGNSEIDETTTEIVLEAATFNPVNIRKTAQRYYHRTEAAIRFEKSLSPELTTEAILRCYELIKQIIPGALAVTNIIDEYPGKLKPIAIDITTDLIRKRLGVAIDNKRIISILTSLGFSIEQKGENLRIGVPHHRATKDVSIPEDIVEEVGRIYGFDNMAPRSPEVTCSPPARNEFRLFERRVKEVLTGHTNMIEVSNYSFVGVETLERLKINRNQELRLSNPLSQEQDRLRRSLVPNLIRNVEYNQRYHSEFGIYELGRVYLKEKRDSSKLCQEKTMVAGALYQKKPTSPLFYHAKEVVLGLLSKLRIADFSLVPMKSDLPPYAHPGRSIAISIGKSHAGYIFELHPEACQAFEIEGRAGMFDIDVDLLFQCDQNDVIFTELQKFPEVPFEISVLADLHTYADEIRMVINNISNDYIRGVEILSVYQGKPIPEDKKSVSMKITFAARNKTLNSEEIEKLQKEVVKQLNSKGYQLR